LLAARSAGSLIFYDWDTGHVIRRIEIAAKHVYWSENGDMVAIAGEESLYILKYAEEAVTNAYVDEIGPDGIEEAFEVIG
jgi:coatomer subunit beta'